VTGGGGRLASHPARRCAATVSALETLFAPGLAPVFGASGHRAVRRVGASRREARRVISRREARRVISP